MLGQLPHRAALIALACVGCASSAELSPSDASAHAQPVSAGPPRPLVELGEFRQVRGDADPFSARVVADRVCQPPVYVVERDPGVEPVLEVRTDVCNYLTLTQPLKLPVHEGDVLQLRMWHNTLVSEVSALGNAALQIGDELVWSVDVAIPGQAESFAPDLEADHSWPVGTPVYLHIHNHGTNAWRFAQLDLVAAAR